MPQKLSLWETVDALLGWISVGKDSGRQKFVFLSHKQQSQQLFMLPSPARFAAVQEQIPITITSSKRLLRRFCITSGDKYKLLISPSSLQDSAHYSYSTCPECSPLPGLIKI